MNIKSFVVSILWWLLFIVLISMYANGYDRYRISDYFLVLGAFSFGRLAEKWVKQNSTVQR